MVHEGKGVAKKEKKKGVKLERGEAKTFFMDRWRVETQNYTGALIFVDLPSQHQEKKKTLQILQILKGNQKILIFLVLISCSKNSGITQAHPASQMSRNVLLAKVEPGWALMALIKQHLIFLPLATF